MVATLFTEIRKSHLNHVKVVLALCLSLCVLAPVSKAFADSPSFYSWYGSSLYLTSVFTGQTRHYDGSNMGIEMNAYSSSGGTFEVELHRAHGLWNDYIGSATFKDNGFTKAVWTSVGEADYYFYFSREYDGAGVSSDDVAMYSW